MGEIFKVMQQTRFFERNVVGGILLLGIFAAALGGSFIGRWVGEHIIYPVGTRNDATATKRMVLLMV